MFDLAVERALYWSRGITMFKPSLPPASWMITITRPLAAVCLASRLSSGWLAYVLIGVPFIINARLAAGAALRKFLRFMQCSFFNGLTQMMFSQTGHFYEHCPDARRYDIRIGDIRI